MNECWNNALDFVLNILWISLLGHCSPFFSVQQLVTVCFSFMGFSRLSPQSKSDWTTISIEAELVTNPSIFAAVASSGQLNYIAFLLLSLPLSFLALAPWSSFGMRKTLKSGQMQKCSTQWGFVVTMTVQPYTPRTQISSYLNVQ